MIAWFRKGRSSRFGAAGLAACALIATACSGSSNEADKSPFPASVEDCNAEGAIGLVSNPTTADVKAVVTVAFAADKKATAQERSVTYELAAGATAAWKVVRETPLAAGDKPGLCTVRTTVG